MKSVLATLFAFLAIHFTSFSQRPNKPTSAEIYQKIQKLNVLGSVLYIAAHPDDENTRLIAYLANTVKANTAYLSLTRGDGGQNLIGPQLRELLGVIRTEELLAARRIDGGQQFFTRANDFGFSKHPDETLAIWDKDKVLSDVVRIIRKFKPDVIINRFDHRTPGSTHGHHTTSAILSVKAFDLVGDQKAYPEQLQTLETWQPKRLFQNTSWWFYGSREAFAKADKSNFVTVDIGSYDPIQGLSNTEIASLSRSQHRSQGFGNTGTRGSQLDYLELLKGDMPDDSSDIFDGIDTSWNRVKGGAPIGKMIDEILDGYDFTNPAASVPGLVGVYKKVAALEDGYWKSVKLQELKECIQASTGLYLEAVADSPTVVPGDQAEITIEAINRSSQSVKLENIKLHPNSPFSFTPTVLKNNAKTEIKATLTVPELFASTNPYWLNEKGSLGMYTVSQDSLIGYPETPRALKVEFHVSVAGQLIPFEKEVVYKKTDPVEGELYRPVDIVPAFSVGIGERIFVFDTEKSQQIPVTVTTYGQNGKGTLTLNAPKNWMVQPKNVDFSIAQKGASQTFVFEVTPPDGASEGQIVPVIRSEGQEYTNTIHTIDYVHIPYQHVALPAESKVVRLDIKKKGQQIGYIDGAGDIIPQSLKQMGYTVTTIDPVEMNVNLLQNFDAIVLGIRAFNTVDALRYKQNVLFDYVKNGGTVIVQYNTNRRLKTEEIAPYPLTLSRDRVTDEYADIKMLNKDHPFWNSPNQITEKDFEGWVQERGLYFPNEWDKAFIPLIATKDKGEELTKGSLLVAPYGKGYYVYTGLSFFRQFPAGVSGAYRIFANLLSLGK